MSRSITIVAAGVVLSVGLLGAILSLRQKSAERATERATGVSDVSASGASVEPGAELSRGRGRQLLQRIDRLEARLAQLEAADPAAEELDIDAAVLATLKDPSPELDGLLTAAVERGSKARGGIAGRKKLTGVNRAATDKYAASVDARLDEWALEYGLSGSQVDELKSISRAAIERISEAKLNGVGGDDLNAMSVEMQAGIRRVVGDDVYGQVERNRITREARGKLAWVSNAVGGLDDDQHAALDRVVDDSMEGRLPDVIRLRSETMSEPEAETLRERVSRSSSETWEEIRDEILTDEQRRRIPGK